MALDTLPALLHTLTRSIESAAATVPPAPSIQPPGDGISLLDTKNELFLAYLHNLVFLIILKLRHARQEGTAEEKKKKEEEGGEMTQVVVEKLVELRVYLEKGVKPLESRLRYQIEKVVRASDEAAARGAVSPGHAARTEPGTGGRTRHHDEDDDDDDDEDADSGPSRPPAHLDDLAYRPNPGALTRPGGPNHGRFAATSSNDGVYKPPRITPTALPSTDAATATAARKPAVSATLDEFVMTELSSAPVAVPSVGSTIDGAGRRSKSARERAAERERDEYEESNYVRLPKEGKKQKGAKRPREQGWGGEEWRGLGEGADRLAGLTKRKSDGVLARSRKRVRGEGEGMGMATMGASFEKKKKKSGLQRRRATFR